MKNKFLYTLLIAAVSLGVTSCANTKDTQTSVNGLEISDPFESTNRAVFAFNNVVDDNVIHPVVKGYRYVVPRPARTGVKNVLRNLKSPVHFSNQVLQGDIEGATTVATRAVINTFVGVGGIFDVAGQEGIEHEGEDFGQTLAVWGVGNGPYIVVPFLGPATLRDSAGFFVDSFADPLRYYASNVDEEEWYFAKSAVEYLSLRESLIDVLKDLEASSIDYYAAVRSTYYQSRDALIRDASDGTTVSSVDDNYGWDDF